ncbi:MAG: polysaccharide biosynthesis PFTS motif protein [Burkholderiales bacterium]
MATADPYKHFRLFNFLSTTPLNTNKSGEIVQISNPAVELCIRQRLVQWVMSSPFLGDLMIAVADDRATITAGLPPLWRNTLVARGIAVHRFRSSLSWWITLARMFLQGARRYVQLLVYSGSDQDPWKETSCPLVLVNADPWQVGLNNATRERRRDTTNWLFDHCPETKTAGLVVHLRGHKACKLSQQLWIAPEPFPPLSLPGRGRFLLRGVMALARAGVSPLIGGWWRAIFIRDEIEDIYTAALPGHHASAYLFCIPRLEYRPFWTCRAAQDGADVKFLFYSANARLFGPGIKMPPTAPGYSVMDWPNVLVWDDFLGQFLSEARGKPLRTETVGPIDYSDSDDPDPAPVSAAVAVFDVTAFQPCLLAARGFPDSYYTQRVLRKFLDDVSQCLEEAGLIMLYKRKRPMIRLAGTAYRRKVEEIIARPRTVIVSPMISARRVIQRSIATIAIPYTSTALIGQALGVPSVYYDPDGTLEEDRSLSHDVPVLRSRKELSAWIAMIATKAAAGKSNFGYSDKP